MFCDENRLPKTSLAFITAFMARKQIIIHVTERDHLRLLRIGKKENRTVGKQALHMLLQMLAYEEVKP